MTIHEGDSAKGLALFERAVATYPLALTYRNRAVYWNSEGQFETAHGYVSKDLPGWYFGATGASGRLRELHRRPARPLSLTELKFEIRNATRYPSRHPPRLHYRPMRLAVLYNPAAGRGRARLHVGEAEGMLRSHGAEVMHYESKSREHLMELARQMTPEMCDRVVVCGGDGSVHLVLRELDLRIPMALLPLGSGDDFAKTLRLPPKLEDVCRVAVKGRVRKIDIAMANGLRYIGVAGVGFDSVCAAEANRVRRLRGSLVYLYAIFKVLPAFNPIPMKISVDGTSMGDEVMFAVVGNTHRYGAGILIAPRAVVDDEILDLYVIGKCSKWDLVKTLPKAYTGSHVTSSFVHSIRGRTFRIETPEPMEVYADGEPLTMTPVDFTLASEKLKVLVGET